MKTNYIKKLNKIFSKDIFYVRIFRKKIEIRNVKTDQEISYKIAQNYSNSRMLIADFEVFEQELRNAIKQIKEPKIFSQSIQIVFQPVDETVTEYSTVEKRVFRDSCEYAGASDIYIYLEKNKLTNQVIIEGINSKFKKSEFER